MWVVLIGDYGKAFGPFDSSEEAHRNAKRLKIRARQMEEFYVSSTIKVRRVRPMDSTLDNILNNLND